MVEHLRVTIRKRLVARATRAVALLTIVLALAVPPSALAWYQYYADHTSFGAGGIALSNSNSGINYNELSWTAYAAMRSTLCDTSYQCYDYHTEDDGFIQDFRSISYGRAKCNAVGAVFVWHCYASNQGWL